MQPTHNKITYEEMISLKQIAEKEIMFSIRSFEIATGLMVTELGITRIQVSPVETIISNLNLISQL